jgi:MFS family permease
VSTALPYFLLSTRQDGLAVRRLLLNKNSVVHSHCDSIAAYDLSGPLAGAFGGLLAYGLVRIQYHDLPAWNWIFFVEGAVTVLFGLLGFLIFPSSPQSAPFLNEQEKKFIAFKLQEDGSAAADEDDDRFKWREVRKAFISPHVILAAIAQFMACMEHLIYF